MKNHTWITRRTFLATAVAAATSLPLLRARSGPPFLLKRYTVNGQRILLVDGWVFAEGEVDRATPGRP